MAFIIFHFGGLNWECRRPHGIYFFNFFFLAGMDMYELNDVLKNVTSIFFF